MRKIVAGLFMSLDGVVEAPETWHFPYFNDEMGQIVSDQMAASDTMLLGCCMYEAFAAFWPNQGDDVPLAKEINGVRKLVASTTLDSVDWQNSELLQGGRPGGPPAPKGRGRQGHLDRRAAPRSCARCSTQACLTSCAC